MGNTQVHAEELPPEETTPEETILVEELPADEQVPEEVQEEDEEEAVVLVDSEKPDETADETETDETTDMVVEEVKEIQPLLINEDGPVFDLPEQLFLPVWYEKQYELPFTLADGYNAADIVWSTANDNIALVEEKDGVLYLSTKQEGETMITGSLNTEDGEVSDSVHVITAHWFEPSVPGMMFEAPGGDPITFTVTAINAAAEMNYTVYSMNPEVASVSVSGDGNTKTVTVTAVNPGTTELYARMTDPNDPAKELDNTFLGVIVCDPEAVLEDLKILNLDDEEITELHLHTGDDPTWVVAEIQPGTILPDKLLMSSTDSEVAYATHGPENMSPYLFFIHAGNKTGSADITFYMEGSEVNVVVHVTVEKEEPEFYISEELYLPIWY
ncbi:MAG: Ig-like domain-containing protein, partial [Solobacterium sp.]|nr:Ig-like domain-containing protein [Solobacterium sp.]